MPAVSEPLLFLKCKFMSIGAAFQEIEEAPDLILQ